VRREWLPHDLHWRRDLLARGLPDAIDLYQDLQQQRIVHLNFRSTAGRDVIHSRSSGSRPFRNASAPSGRRRGRTSPGRVHQELNMNWDRIEGNWKQLKGKAKVRWGKLTDDQFDVIAGKREQLVGRVQEKYGIAKEEAEKQVDQFAASLKEEALRHEKVA
jgi:uncharacterized protein YjbJ (UPF0337 family)